jgi:hypothetical protein
MSAAAVPVVSPASESVPIGVFHLLAWRRLSLQRLTLVAVRSIDELEGLACDRLVAWLRSLEENINIVQVKQWKGLAFVGFMNENSANLREL